MNIGNKIKELREERGWSQEQLARKSGLTRGYISVLELRGTTDPRARVLLKLAEAFNISLDELYEVAGYKPTGEKVRTETPEEILERLKLASPVAIPVYDHFTVHAGPPTEAPSEYIYRARAKTAGKNIEAYIVHGHCMKPKIEDGDIVIVDRDIAPEVGRVVLCVVDGEVYVGRLIKENRKVVLKNGHGTKLLKDCNAVAVVIGVNKNF
jgi:Predicted transcriptional regulators